MSEIKVSIPDLADCNGNLKSLASSWSAMPNVPDDVISTSKGASADCVKLIPDVTEEVAKAFTDLLSNSLAFFSAAGITYVDMDEKAADSMDALSS